MQIVFQIYEKEWLLNGMNSTEMNSRISNISLLYLIYKGKTSHTVRCPRQILKSTIGTRERRK